MSTNVTKVIRKLRPGQSFEASNQDELISAVIGNCRGCKEEMREARAFIRDELRAGHFVNSGINSYVYRPNLVTRHSRRVVSRGSTRKRVDRGVLALNAA